MTKLRTFLAAFALGLPAIALTATPVMVHRDPGCACCEQWARQVKAQFGRDVRIIDDTKRPEFARQHGVPAGLASCHTAIVDGMTFEGHVPIADMKRVLAQRPRGVAGLAVAGMPMGSPGMEMKGVKADHYQVIAFGPRGRSVFARY